MAPKPIIFALANPDPEISYPEAREASPDASWPPAAATTRTRSTTCWVPLHLPRGARRACAPHQRADEAGRGEGLAALAREDVPDQVSRAYGGEHFVFGPDYIIPKPFDRACCSGSPRRGQGRDGHGRRAPDRRPGRLPRAPAEAAVAQPPGDGEVFTRRAESSLASRSTTVSTRACCRPHACCAKRAVRAHALGDRAKIEAGIIDHKLEDELGRRHHRRPRPQRRRREVPLEAYCNCDSAAA
jgi:hypothetical protein